MTSPTAIPAKPVDLFMQKRNRCPCDADSRPIPTKRGGTRKRRFRCERGNLKEFFPSVCPSLAGEFALSLSSCPRQSQMARAQLLLAQFPDVRNLAYLADKTGGLN